MYTLHIIYIYIYIHIYKYTNTYIHLYIPVSIYNKRNCIQKTIRRTRIQILVNIGIKANANTTVYTMTSPPTSINSIANIHSGRNMIANTDTSISISSRMLIHIKLPMFIQTHLSIPCSTSTFSYVMGLMSILPFVTVCIVALCTVISIFIMCTSICTVANIKSSVLTFRFLSNVFGLQFPTFQLCWT